MERNISTLDHLPLNKNGYIESLSCIGDIRRRLQDLGLIKGTLITPVLVSPAKDPRAFEFRGSVIAIRKEDANLIHVSF